MPTKRPSIEKRVLDAALELAADRGWNAAGMAEIAAAADVTLAQLNKHYPTRPSIIAAFMRGVDSAVLAGGDAEGDKPRDRLFDIMMRRYDALGEHRAAVKAIARAVPTDPATAIVLLCQLRRSLATMLEAAGINSSGPRGRIRVQGLGLIHLATFRVWLRDDTADQARTMAELDRNLRRAETVVECIEAGPLGRPRETSEAA